MQCDYRGQCPCRDLVTGPKCDRCRQATFGLDARNAAGCLRCFCFDRSQECRQSDMMWGQIRSYGARNLSVEHVAAADEAFVVLMQQRGTAAEYRVADFEERHDVLAIPGAAGNVSMAMADEEFGRPLYWQLPPQYTGDRLGSYGGWLNFSVRADGVDDGEELALPAAVLRRYPLVQLRAHNALVLDYFGPQRADAAPAATFAVGMNETFWRRARENVTRAVMMTALQNVTGIFVRATAWSDFEQVM